MHCPCNNLVIHKNTIMHYPCIQIPCILIYALPIVHCHSSCFSQDHKHATTFILLFTRSRSHRSNIIKCPLPGTMYSKHHAYNIISMQFIASKACLSTTYLFTQQRYASMSHYLVNSIQARFHISMNHMLAITINHSSIFMGIPFHVSCFHFINETYTHPT